YSFMTRIKLATSKHAPLEHELIMYRAMERLINTSVKKRELISKTLIAYPIGQPFAMDGSNLFNKLFSEIAHEMLGILLVLPYFELLKKATAMHSELSQSELSKSVA